MTTTDPRPPVVAIGDVHGCATLLREAGWPHLGSGAELIFLGDLIDRSPERDGDRQVIELVRELQATPEAYGLEGVTVLRGNHDQMLLDTVAEDEPDVDTDLWEWNGGDTDLLPFYRKHRAWFEALPHRIANDTGAFTSGQLTALPLAQWTNPENRQVSLGECMPAALDPPSDWFEFSELLTAASEMSYQLLVLAGTRSSIARPYIHTSSVSETIHYFLRLRLQHEQNLSDSQASMPLPREPMRQCQ